VSRSDREQNRPQIVVVQTCAHAVVFLRTEATQASWACRDCRLPFTPAPPKAVHEALAKRIAVDDTQASEYMSVRELARRIPYGEGTIRNLMSQGQLKLGVHYVKPQGRVMFRWSAVRAWLEGREPRET